MAEQWLSIVEYARTFAISDMTIRRRIKTGKLHAVLKDGKYYIPVPPEKASAVSQNIPSAPIQNEPSPERVLKQQFIRPAESTVGSAANFRETTKETISYPEVVRQSPAVVAKQVQPVSHVQQFGSIPSHITQAYDGTQYTQAESRALLEFCERSLKSNASLIQSIEDKHRARETSFQSQLQNKDMEISKLRQQIEDLQVLVKMLEKKI